MNQEYFDDLEDKCYEKLLELNKHTNYFKKIERQEHKAAIDAMAVGRNNKPYAIELKYRENYDLLKDSHTNYYLTNDKGFKDDTLFIENHKLSALLLEKVYDNKTPIYMNFFRNGMTTIHDVSKLKEKPDFDKEKTIKSFGYEKMEVSKRYLLPLSDCTILDNKYNILQLS